MENIAMPVWESLYEKVSPVVTAYRSDLDTDKFLIEHHEGVPFLHFARETGTWIYHLHEADSQFYPRHDEYVPHLFGTANREELAYGIKVCIEQCCRSESTLLVHYYDGKKLKLIDGKQAAIVCKDWYAEVTNAWKAERRLACSRH
jgi:hypothetical protein